MSENTINIIPIRFEKDFTIVSNSTFHDENLTIHARGLLAYLLTCPPNWKIHTWQLAKIYSGTKKGNGLDAIKESMKELRLQGYVKYSKTRDSKGLWIHNYQIYPIAIKEFQKKYPERDQPAMDQPAMVNPSLNTNTELLNTDLNVCTVPATPPARFCEITSTSNHKTQVTHEELMRHATVEDKNWTREEIDSAWAVLTQYKQPVNDWLLFIEGTIKNFRLKQQNIKFMEKKCQKETKDSGNGRILTKPLEIRKDFYSVNDTSERPLAIAARRHGLKYS